MKKTFQKFLEFAFLQTVGVMGFSAYVNLAFGFNVFSISHWKFFADMQLDGGKISTAFYAAILCFVLYSVLVVWFVLVRPRRRIFRNNKVALIPPSGPGGSSAEETVGLVPLGLTRPKRMSPSFNSVARPVETTPAYPVYTEPPAISAPVPSVSVPQVAPSTVAPAPKAPKQKEVEIESSSKPDVLRIMESAGFGVAKNAPLINDVALDVWATNGDELYIGLVCGAHGRITAKEGGSSVWSSDIDGEFKSPVSGIYSAAESIRKLISETLDEGTIVKVTAFVVMADGNIENYDKLSGIFEAFGVSVFGHGVPEFEAWARKIEMLPKNESFIEYMDAIVSYYAVDAEEGAS
ncbi:MAG: hypothetical protein FWD33_00535 [Alphaproteobacteria bacterium]|nr:hypothetical protein [Alphaproteobacteria bacterium]